MLIAAADGPRHGYELARALGDWRPANMGQLYRLLRQLEATGLMTSTWEHSGAGPSRRVYSPSPAGEQAAAEARATVGHLESTLDRFTSRYGALCRRRDRPGPAAVDVGHDVGPGPPAPEGDASPVGDAAAQRAVRRYLEALEAKRALPPSTKELHAHLALLDELVARADLHTCAPLVQRRQNLAAAAAIASADSLAQAEADFVAVARAYSDHESISAAAWQDSGVEARVLQAAGLVSPNDGSAATAAGHQAPCPKPLLRCWLLLLVGERSRHGHELYEALVGADVGLVDPSRVYRVLHCLDEDALSASCWQTGLGPDRRVYSLTPAGIQALDACAAGVVELRRGLRCRGATDPAGPR
ncbi:MAG: PadR family transcriptional regulator [Acidimicrobiales bacterium]